MAKRRIQYGRGANQIELDDTIHDLVANAMENLAPGLYHKLSEVAEELYDEARAEWPVRKGWSRDALDWGVRIPDADMTVVESYVGFKPGHKGSEYAHLIKALKHGNKQTWRVLLQHPARKRAEKLGEELRDVIMGMFQRGGRAQ